MRRVDSRWVALALIFVTRTSMGVQFQSIASVGPLLVADLGLSYAQVGTLIGLYLLPGVALSLPGGLIGQRFGDRRAVVCGLAAMVVGGLLTAWSGGFVGAAWGVFFASLAAVIAFGPPMLVARGASLGQAGFEVSLAIWVTIVSVPLGGLLSDRVGRPNAFIVVGSLGGAGLLWALPTMPAAALGLVLVGAVIGAAPGPLTSLLPRALAPERLAGGLGVSYTVYYLVMAAVQPVAGLLRDRTGDPATPVRFAAAAMAATVVGLAAFRLIERRGATSRSMPP